LSVYSLSNIPVKPSTLILRNIIHSTYSCWAENLAQFAQTIIYLSLPLFRARQTMQTHIMLSCALYKRKGAKPVLRVHHGQGRDHPSGRETCLAETPPRGGRTLLVEYHVQSSSQYLFVECLYYIFKYMGGCACLFPHFSFSSSIFIYLNKIQTKSTLSISLRETRAATTGRGVRGKVTSARLI
jgi:hypothetical protein